VSSRRAYAQIYPRDEGLVQLAVVVDLSSYLQRMLDLTNWHVLGTRRLAAFAFDINILEL